MDQIDGLASDFARASDHPAGPCILSILFILSLFKRTAEQTTG
jgi:hypothetical protein